jgi:murein DD-endopeptidase MepM/ murein hydrolase activator NlpD
MRNINHPYTATLMALFISTACEGDEQDLDSDTRYTVGDTSNDHILNQAVLAQNDGDFDRALSLYARLEDSVDQWYSWMGTSGMVAVNRMRGDYDAAREVTAAMRLKLPDRAGLSHLWDGDTAALEGDFQRALLDYHIALDDYADEASTGEPLGVAALRQISRVQLGMRAAAAAATTSRRLVSRYPGSADAEFELASAIAYDAMADDALPIGSLGSLIHDGECQVDDPCKLTSRGMGVVEIAAPGISLAGLQTVRFLLSPEDAALHEAIMDSEPLELLAKPAAVVCVTPIASSGFIIPLANDHSGYKFMDSPDAVNGYHTGLDVNGPGPGNADCNLTFYAASVGCVTDSSPKDWGSATVQSSYSSQKWTQQYGHASEIFYSVGSLIAKGAALGKVGSVGADTCHLHFEIREQDHPAATNANWYAAITQTNVGDYYQDPYPFIAAHGEYATDSRVDEEQFTFFGAWTSVAGVGNDDDMRYALTTAVNNKTNYARYTFTPVATRTHLVYAFVPWNHGTSTAASVKLLTGGNNTLISKTIDQSNFYDSWVYVGQANLVANTDYYLEIASNTGEGNRKVGIDDFLFLGI